MSDSFDNLQAGDEDADALDAAAGGAAAVPGGGPGSAQQAWISHAPRRLEPWVAWSIAVCTAWVAAVAFRGMALPWLFVLYAVLIGQWARVRPSRLQAEMFLRGAALVAGAYVLHTQAGLEVGGPAGAFFFWLSITALYYAFMLQPAWAVALVLLALAGFAAAALRPGHGTALDELLAQGGFLFIFPLVLALRFGVVMRRPDETLEQGQVDAATALYNHNGLLAHGGELLAACRRDGRPLCMVVLDCADLLEVRGIYGSRVGRELLDCVVHKLNLIAGERGLAARTGPAEFALLLPGLTRERALGAVQRVLGSPSCIELDADDSEIMLVPDLALRVAGPGTTSVGQLHALLCRELEARHENETRHLRHLARERERHSRPMGLAAPAPVPRSNQPPEPMPPRGPLGPVLAPVPRPAMRPPAMALHAMVPRTMPVPLAALE